MARSSKHSGAKFANGNFKSYQGPYDAQPEQIKKRAEHNKKNRAEGTYGNGDGKDWAKTKPKKGKKPGWKLQIASVNRANNAHGKRPRYS